MLIKRFAATEIRALTIPPRMPRSRRLGETFDEDVKSEGEKFGIGGWRRHSEGDTHECERFSMELARATALWALARGELFRATAALELLGTLMSMIGLAGPLAHPPTVTPVSLLATGLQNQEAFDFKIGNSGTSTPSGGSVRISTAWESR